MTANTTNTAPAGAITSTRDVIEGFWAAHSTGERERLKTFISPDIEWTVVGRTVPLAKTYTGWQGFFDELLAALDASFKPGSVVMKRSASYVDEEAGVGVIELFESAVTNDGKKFENNIVDVLHVKNGLIVSAREYMDLAEVKDAFGF
ncbi:hypothetical protein FQ154_19435 [Paeniglutamicibacter gangotriensis]|uniref:Nuclear transport factor 2 family protein n=1 Tax=Paeniglutamicibacter gangotriensis TaxID=254787 RepID=A0A5B0E4R7_9MICC|nr:hypothetical protein [Paeniglutamicibacter gangotriensis]KAA0973175.1 hypothetical protein FQ154_19435 [Paeniglutamicibacter gangotriensis]